MSDVLPNPDLLEYLGFREKQARQQTLSALPAEAKLVLTGQHLYLEGLSALRHEHLRERWRYTLGRLASRSFDSLRTAHETLLDGYPLQAIALVRAVDEDLVTAAYIRKHRRDARFWWAKKYMNVRPKIRRVRRGTKPRKSPRGVPDLITMHEDLGEDSPLPGAVKYGLASVVAHPRMLGLTLQSSKGATPGNIWPGGHFHPVHAALAYTFLIDTMFSALGELRQLVGGKDADWEVKVANIAEQMQDWMRSRPLRMAIKAQQDRSRSARAAIPMAPTRRTDQPHGALT